MWSPGLSEGFEVDGQVVNVSGQSRDILFMKKCQANDNPGHVLIKPQFF